MSFVLPWMLGAGLLAALGVVALHLLSTQRPPLRPLPTARFVPESRAEHARRVDPVGQLLVLALFATLTYAIIEGPDAGWTSVRTLGLFAVAAAALVVGGAVLATGAPIMRAKFRRSRR